MSSVEFEAQPYLGLTFQLSSSYEMHNFSSGTQLTYPKMLAAHRQTRTRVKAYSTDQGLEPLLPYFKITIVLQRNK